MSNYVTITYRNCIEISGSVSIEGVTCVAAPAGREWERPRILLSGHTDGTIRVWARELVPSRSPNSTSRLVQAQMFSG